MTWIWTDMWMQILRNSETQGWTKSCVCEVKEWVCYDYWRMSIALGIKSSDIYWPVNLGGWMHWSLSGYARSNDFKGKYSRRLVPGWRLTFHHPPSCTPQYFKTTMAPLDWIHHLGQIQGRVTLPWNITSSENMLVREKRLWYRGWNINSKGMISLPKDYQKKHSSISESYSRDGDCDYSKARER